MPVCDSDHQMAAVFQPRRLRRQHGRTFYLTVLVVSLFACYSLIRSVGQAAAPQDAKLVLRSLEGKDLPVCSLPSCARAHSDLIQCRQVNTASDQCAFVHSNCPDEEAGIFSYLQLYYCRLPNAKPLAFTILVVWLALLFSTIGIAASDFLCINLSTIATLLGMSESLTGVTFLAFGNGSPDVFSTFAAMSSHSGSLAVGELVGAAGFITAVVAGSMAVTKPFQVARKSFIRDVSFFAVAASFSIVFLADGRLRLWECVVMVAFYVFYVVFVVVWHWYLTRRRRIKLAELSARLHHHVPDTQELEAPEFHDDEEIRPTSERTPLVRAQSGESVHTLLSVGRPAWASKEDEEDDEVRDRYLAELQSNMRVRGRGERRNTMTPIRPSLIGALEFRSVLSSLSKQSTGDTMNLRRFSEDAVNLLGDASSSPPELPTTVPQGDARRRNRAVSANDAEHLQIDADLLNLNEEETAVTSASITPTPEHTRPSASYLSLLNDDASANPPSPSNKTSSTPGHHHSQSSLSQTRPKSPMFLAPPQTTSTGRVAEDSNIILSPLAMSPSSTPVLQPSSGPTLQVPILHSPHPKDVHRNQALTHSFPVYTDANRVRSRSSSRAGSIRLPPASLSPESTNNLTLLQDESEEDMKIYSWWPYHLLVPPQVIVSTLFPTLYGWREKGIVDKLLGIVTAPSVLLLTVTLPVVDNDGGNDLPDPDPGLLTPGATSRQSTMNRLPADTPNLNPSKPGHEGPQHPHSSLTRNHSSTIPKTPITENIDEMPGPKDWNRWLVFVQVFTAPFFVVTILWANMDDSLSLRLYLRLVLGGLVFSLVCLFILLGTTSHNREPKYRPLLCFLGFAVAIGWISSIANEVVGVLKAIGVILNISDAILGLTIFAVGNSCGDLVADITVAKLGFPVMALSACFGGPMLNILLGIGLSGMYMTIRHGMAKHEKHPDRPIHYKPYELDISTTLVISGITLLVTLLGLLIVVPLNGWRMDRKIGAGLIALWCLSTLGNVIVEVMGLGGDITEMMK
jgi:solute carrier family 24 (sodium/potassium/calcium exchanger), member 6